MPQNPLIRGITGTHTADVNVQAVRNGWLPFYPQFDRSPLQVVRDAKTAGAKTDEDVVNYAVDEFEIPQAAFLCRKPRRAGELAARLVHLARERSAGQREGPRVLPTALSRYA